MQMMPATLVGSQLPVMGRWVESEGYPAAWLAEQALDLGPWALGLEVGGRGLSWLWPCLINGAVSAKTAVPEL